MNNLLETQLRENLGELYATEPAFQSGRFRELLSVIDRVYRHHDFERSLLESAIDLNSRELHATNDLLEKKNQRISHLSTMDTLTGLPNRYLYNDRINEELKRAKRHDRKLAVMFIDLDRFKIINDSLGHHIGDLLLRYVAKRIKSCLREVDTVARPGGDEFTILLDEVREIEDAAAVARKILSALSEPFKFKGHELMLTASIGISIFPSDGVDLSTLLRSADTAMYRAKELGRNNFQFYHPAMSIKALEYMAFESRLRKALEHDEFVLHYQPQIDLGTGKITGMEALVRWESPEIGFIMPSDFIPLAEETGLILPIGEWVLQAACLQNKAWQEAGLQQIQIAVNISQRQLQNPCFMDSIDTALEMSGLAPEFLDLELTESAVMQETELSLMTLQQIKQKGICLSIDDFGTGYSSLSVLKRFTIDRLKIDRSFVSDISDNPDATAIVEAIIGMAYSLNLNVIAEGVGTRAQSDFLQENGCDHIQGFWISKPLPADEAGRFLREGPAL